MAKKPKSNNQAYPTLRRDASAALRLYRGELFERPDANQVLMARFILNEAGQLPDFVHGTPIKTKGLLPGTVEVSYLPDHPELLGVTVRRPRGSRDPDAKPEAFHVAFTAASEPIVTDLVDGSFMPVAQEERNIKFGIAQSMLDAAINQKVHSNSQTAA